MAAFGKEGSTVLATLVAYQARVLPLVHRELRRWVEVAGAIPDSVLRRKALSALTEKASNVEAIAVFATLAPRSTRASAIRALVALQVAVDYLDTLGEQAGDDPLRDGLRLHEALGVALTPGAPAADWYALHPQSEDGGYLDRLVAACQQSVLTLPSNAQVLPIASRAAARCGEAQSRTHATATEGAEALEAWAGAQAAASIFSWWEVAAGASSSVAAHALIAAAAAPGFTELEAEAIDDAYFPAIGALTVLLDNLVDRDQDREAGEHSYIDYYADPSAAADRLGLIVEVARSSTAGLRNSRRHDAILTGIVAYYLAQPGADAEFARPVKARLMRSSGVATRPLASLLRLRRRL